MKIVIIDNYDSFTYNLAHLVKELGAEVDVLRNDRFALTDLETYDKIILSPGPGIPEEAGLLLDVIRTYAGRKPILGVCLGEQAIGQVFGGKLVNLSEVFHGVQAPAFLAGNEEHISLKEESMQCSQEKDLKSNAQDGNKACSALTEESMQCSEKKDLSNNTQDKNKICISLKEESMHHSQEKKLKNNTQDKNKAYISLKEESIHCSEEKDLKNNAQDGNKAHISLEHDYIFNGLPQEILVGRYHSWVVDTNDLPDCLAITAISAEGQIMALKHREYDVRGIQFHPESVLTPDGKQIMKNWLTQHN